MQVRDQPDDDELMDAVLLELQVQIGVGKAAGAPMLAGVSLRNSSLNHSPRASVAATPGQSTARIPHVSA